MPTISMSLRGLPAPLTIRRDEHGIPHSSARKRMISSFAFPWTGGEDTSSFQASPKRPVKLVCFALRLTLSWMYAFSRNRLAPGDVRSEIRDSRRLSHRKHFE